MKKTILSLLLGAVIACSGCRMYHLLDNHTGKKHELEFSSEFRLAYEPRYSTYDLKESKTIPVHPDDSSFLHGDTEVKADRRLYLASLNGGFAGKAEILPVVLKAGSDLELSIDKYAACDEYKQQSSDYRSKNSGSFVYDRIDPDALSLLPFVGAEISLGNFDFQLEYGLPIRKLTRSWGHYRWASEDEIGNESDSVVGRKIKAGARFVDRTDKSSHRPAIGLEFSKEEYDTKWGDIDSYSIMLNLAWGRD